MSNFTLEWIHDAPAERQDLSCTYLIAHHELESIFMMMMIIIDIINCYILMMINIIDIIDCCILMMIIIIDIVNCCRM